uniref:Eukaryotic translation initiation factor 4E transporter n=1 Tax=Acrobeloides nanus TaxID=290746 RepID=A0A914CRG8_9BILA
MPSQKNEAKYSKYRYSRSEMVTLRETPLSRTRPSYLSVDFNNENGLFSPDKWLQHRWVCEGIESRYDARKKPTNLKPETSSALESEATVLSPQRRGFSSGCRAPSPKYESDKPQLKQIVWRNSKASNGMDFKPAFQKNALESGRSAKTASGGITPSWRTNAENSFKPFDKAKGKLRGSIDRDRLNSGDKLPDWFDEGPTSMTDVIELKGFEEDEADRDSGRAVGQKLNKNTNHQMSYSDSASVSSEEVSMLKTVQHEATSNLTSSMENLDNIRTGESTLPFAMPYNGLPFDSDAEFAKLILEGGAFDSSPLHDIKDQIPTHEPQISTSRLSRFFTKPEALQNATPFNPSNNNMTQFGQRPIVGQTSEDQAYAGPSILQKLFANVPTKGEPMEPPTNRGFKLEDIERDIRDRRQLGDPLRNLADSSASEQSTMDPRRLAQFQYMPPNSNIPLSDPVHQAQLWQKLNHYANQHDKQQIPDQERSTVSPPQNIGGPSVFQLNEQQHPMQVPPQSYENQFRLQQQFRAAALLHAQMLQFYQHHPEQLQNLQNHPQAMQAAFNNHIQMMRATAAANMGNAPYGMPNIHPDVTIPSTSANAPKNVVSASFMPTSVMRQLTKTTSSANSAAGSSVSNTPSNLQPISSHAIERTPSRELQSPSISGISPVPGRGSPQIAPRIPSPELQNRLRQDYCATGRLPSPKAPAHDVRKEQVLIQQKLAQMAAMMSQNLPGLPMAGVPPGVWRGPMIPPGMNMGNPQFHMRGAFPQGPFAMHPGMMNMHPINPLHPVSNMPPPMNNPPFHPQVPEQSSPFSFNQKLQNPLEKLLVSPPGATPDTAMAPAPGLPKTTLTNDKPAILNRLPPTAKPLTVEDLEREIAAAALGK